MTDRYILNADRNAVPCPNLAKWAEWFETGNRIVSQTEIGKLRISTVFLGLDHQFGSGPPLLFETMIFLPRGDDSGREYQERCSTWAEAEAMHAAAVVVATEWLAKAASAVGSVLNKDQAP